MVAGRKPTASGARAGSVRNQSRAAVAEGTKTAGVAVQPQSQEAVSQQSGLVWLTGCPPESMSVMPSWP